MKRSSIFSLVGGTVGLLAFFLPFFSITILGTTLSISLFDLLRAANQTNLGSDLSGQLALGWVEPVAAAILILFALLAGKMGRSAHGLNLVGALVGLGFLIYVFAKLQSLLADVSGPIAGLTPTSLLGIGFWAAGVAFILGLVGAIMGLGEKREAVAQPGSLAPPTLSGQVPQVLAPGQSGSPSQPLTTDSSGQVAQPSAADQSSEPTSTAHLDAAPTVVSANLMNPSGPIAPGRLPQAQLSPLGYAPAPAKTPSKSGSPKSVLIVLLVVLVVGGGMLFYFTKGGGSSPSPSASYQNPSDPSFDRHGLPTNIPLPDQVAFAGHAISNSDLITGQWIWTTPSSLAGVNTFYMESLPSNGWTRPPVGFSGEVVGCQGNMLLEVSASDTAQSLENDSHQPISTVKAPSNGSAFKIALSTDGAVQGLVAQTCGGSTTGSTPPAGGTSITLFASTFGTDSIALSRGSTLTFVDDANMGATHILVIGANGIAEEEAGAPDFGGAAGHTLMPGDTWTTLPWNQVGTYHISCLVHPATMNLTVTVTG